MTEPLPPIAELLPQRGAMRLLGRVIAHGADGTRCALEPGAGALFREEDGRLPAWLALELMAQCAAVDGALRLRSAGAVGPPPAGLLLGSRRLDLGQPWLDAERGLEVRARRVSGRGRRFAFECALEDGSGGEPLAAGRINVLLADDLPGVGGAGDA